VGAAGAGAVGASWWQDRAAEADAAQAAPLPKYGSEEGLLAAGGVVWARKDVAVAAVTVVEEGVALAAVVAEAAAM
jgi:hypothetical protein